MSGMLGAGPFIGRVGGHESFPPRYGWLKKGFDAVLKDPGIFNRDRAIVELGVGKNMVRSIRYWCQACKVIETGERGKMVPTSFGRMLLSDDGWDPYLEDPATYWLLHWQLFIPPFYAVGWPLAFNQNTALEFDIDDLADTIRRAAQNHPRLANVSIKTYRREASCMIRMYTDGQEEDWEAESSFVQLGLMRRADKRQVCFNLNAKHGLPSLIFAAACLSYAQSYLVAGQKTMSLQRLVYGVNSPGVAFKLCETDVGQYLLNASKEFDGFTLVQVLGDTQMHFEESPEQLYLKALTQYYRAYQSSENEAERDHMMFAPILPVRQSQLRLF